MHRQQSLFCYYSTVVLQYTSILLTTGILEHSTWASTVVLDYKIYTPYTERCAPNVVVVIVVGGGGVVVFVVGRSNTDDDENALVVDIYQPKRTNNKIL